MALTPASILADYSSGIGTQGATLKVDANNERVGIGTTNPQGTLQVGTAITMGSGIITATSFDGNTATFSGNVSVGGTLTYEDVTNVDSVGIITARQDIHVGGGLSVTGISNLNGITTSTTTLFANNFSVSGVSTLGGNVVVGGATTELVVTGDARVTGILTVGTASLTLNGTTGAITGGSLTNAQVATISSEISDTAVDVFVYDTRKDSDGGAWRKRTQHTSWYNETLNTSTRGSRREFPSVAVIVATAASSRRRLIIYDGDDPNLPMWMIVDSTDGQWHQTETASPVYALNGIIALGSSSDAYPLYATRNRLDLFNFISDKIEGSTDSATYNGVIKGISNRSDVAVQNKHIGDNPYTLVSYRVNDLAMTVLPNAPIDDTTGLPIPTIAVATNGGVSVIRDDGSVPIITGFAPTQKVEIDEKYVISTARTVGYDFIYKVKIPSVTSSFGSLISSGVGGGLYANSGFSGDVAKPLLRNDNTRGLAYSPDNTIIMGGDLGLEIIAEETNINGYIANQSNAESPIAYISSSYNTGWMYGDIKGAFLSDTTVESLTANTNLASSATQTATARLTSETYTDGATSWQMVDNAGSANGYLAISFGGLTIGQSYHLSMTVDANAALDVGYEHKIEQGSSIIYLNHWNGTSAGTLTANFTTISGNNVLYFYANGITVNVTNFNIRAVDDEDRSVNNNGLAVYGTITKSAVATGAELVSYSGWSASNNLVQPYNSDLNFGTGDFCFVAWIKKATLSTNHYVLDRNDGGSESDRFSFMITSDGKMSLYSGATGAQNQSAAIFAGSSVWRMVMVKRNSGAITFGLDGKEYVSTTIAGNWSTTNITGSGDENLFIGQFGGGGAPGSVAYNADYGIGEIANVRVSASAPSAEQIKKMYEDEKVLFQENAKATLYGSSDAVTALAYDEDTELLHVGTSSGRSDFQGLRRINNTTTAVTTAISASNDLVAEQ